MGPTILWIVLITVTLAAAVDAARFRRDEYVTAEQRPDVKTMVVFSPLLLLCVGAGALIAVYYFVWVRPKLARVRRGDADAGLSDEEWLAAGERRYESLIGRHYGSPETIAAGGDERLGAGDAATALFFYQKSIDLLHTLYLSSEMRSRRPGRADEPMIGDYLTALADVRETHPGAPVAASVGEVTHRLRTIATACRDARLDPSRYLAALDTLRELAPDVDVSKIFWRNPDIREVLGDDWPPRGPGAGR